MLVWPPIGHYWVCEGKVECTVKPKYSWCCVVFVTILSALGSPNMCQVQQVEESGHETAKVGSFMATFDRGWKAAIELPRSAVWEPKLPQCWKPAMKLPRSAVWGHSAEKRPSNCQGRQFENMHLIMDWANGWKAAVKLPRSAVWGPKAPKCWKPAIKLPRSAVWERGRQTAKVGSLSPRKKVWLKLPRSAVLWPLFQTSKYGRFTQVIR